MPDRVNGPGEVVTGLAEADVEPVKGRHGLIGEILPEILEGDLADGILEKQHHLGDSACVAER